jgi:hypothetical protein
MDWLTSEDLKEGGNQPVVTITRQRVMCLIKIDL